MTPINSQRYEKLSNRPRLMVFTAIDHERNEKGFNYIANRLRKIAKEHAKSSPLIYTLGNSLSLSLSLSLSPVSLSLSNLFQAMFQSCCDRVIVFLTVAWIVI
jgi:hypothetical protein